eukprot:10263056-Heterocapsa_arctica.AAC.1
MCSTVLALAPWPAAIRPVRFVGPRCIGRLSRVTPLTQRRHAFSCLSIQWKEPFSVLPLTPPIW